MSEDSSMGMIAKAFTITGLGMIASSVVGLVKTRVIATLEGTEGVGLLGQFTYLQALIGGLAALGLSTGIVKYLSQYLESKEFTKIRNSFQSAAIMVLCSSVAFALAMSLLSSQISTMLVGDDSARDYVLIIAASVPFLALSSIFNGLINGARGIKTLARVSVYSALGSLAIAIPSVYFLGLQGVVVQIAATSVIALALYFFYARKVTEVWPTPAKRPSFDRAESRLLLHFGAVAMITGMLLPLTLLVTQTAVIRQEGLSSNGLFQAAWALFWLYIGFATSSVLVYLFPTMSATKDESQLSGQVNNGVRFLALATTPVSCLLLLFPGVVLTILYSSEFTEASWLLQVMVVAGAFRIISFPISITLIAKAHLKEYLPIEASWYAVFAVIVIAFLPTLGLEAIAVAVLAAYIVHTVLYIVFVRKILGLFYTQRNWFIVVSSGAILAIVLVLNLTVPIAAYIAAAALVPLWLMYATEEQERRWLTTKLHMGPR